MKRWAVRKIQGGEIRLNGNVYRPPAPIGRVVPLDEYIKALRERNGIWPIDVDCPYDGRWEGNKVLVGAYKHDDRMINLHSRPETGEMVSPDPDMGGFILWDIWYRS